MIQKAIDVPDKHIDNIDRAFTLKINAYRYAEYSPHIQILMAELSHLIVINHPTACLTDLNYSESKIKLNKMARTRYNRVMSIHHKGGTLTNDMIDRYIDSMINRLYQLGYKG